MLRILIICIPLLLSGCAVAASGYIQVLIEPGKVMDYFDNVVAVIKHDTLFKEGQYSLSHGYNTEWRIEGSFYYDPKETNVAGQKVHYSARVVANSKGGALGVFYAEVMRREMSEGGRVLFDDLVAKLQGKFGEENIVYGTDDEGNKALRKLVKQ